MDKNEFGMFASAIRTFYPKEQILPNKEAMQLWYRELCDIPFDVAEAALRKWVSTQKWSPSIAEIREMAAEVAHGEALDWTEAWEKTCYAIRRYGLYRPKEALESLDPLTRECVKRMGFTNLCTSENPIADRANFRQCFEILAKREQIRNQLALPLQQKINSLRIESGDGGFLRIESGLE